MEDTTFATVLQLINSGGLVAVLVFLVRLFYRGDILSRKVWEELTTRVVNQLSTRYEQTTAEMVKEIASQVAGCTACARPQETKEV